MKYRTLSIVFMVLMLAGLVATFWLFFELKNSKARNQILDENLAEKNKVLEEKLEEVANLNDYLKIEQQKYTMLKDSVDEICPELSQIKEEIDNQAGFSIGINYKSTNKLESIKSYIEGKGFEIYYSKQDSDVHTSFVLYYSEEIRSVAEAVAKELSSLTSLNFMPLKGRTPESITDSNLNKTLLIHVNN